MSRSTVRKVFVTGLVVWVVGIVIMLLTHPSGQAPNSAAYTAGIMLVAAGILIGIVSWILALISSAVLGRWGWFIFVLILGIIGLLPLVMIVYSLIGPTQRRVLRPTVA